MVWYGVCIVGSLVKIMADNWIKAGVTLSTSDNVKLINKSPSYCITCHLIRIFHVTMLHVSPATPA